MSEDLLAIGLDSESEVWMILHKTPDAKDLHAFGPFPTEEKATEWDTSMRHVGAYRDEDFEHLVIPMFLVRPIAVIGPPIDPAEYAAEETARKDLLN